MKRTLTLILIATSLGVFAQRKTPKTLIDTDPEEISGFGASLFSFMPIDGELSTLTGGGGAVIFDNTFFIGGYGLGMSGDRKINVEGTDYTANFGHGGFWLGYIMKPVEMLHLGVETKLGWGEIKYKSAGLDPVNDKVFVFSPQLIGEVNLAYWFKMNAGVGLQKTIGVDEFYFDKSDFDGPTFSISLLFGWFK
ncbi:MAG: hypothetical protein RIM99_01575 [Cyclobacteriaceae bacterium]